MCDLAMSLAQCSYGLVNSPHPALPFFPLPGPAHSLARGGFVSQKLQTHWTQHTHTPTWIHYAIDPLKAIECKELQMHTAGRFMSGLREPSLFLHSQRSHISHLTLCACWVIRGLGQGRGRGAAGARGGAVACADSYY